jgi:hypothetical protein
MLLGHGRHLASAVTVHQLSRLDARRIALHLDLKLP